MLGSQVTPLWTFPTTFLVASALVATPAGATVLYQLQPESSFQQGCFPPCLCPMMETAKLDGTFELGLITIGDVFDFYEVAGVRWFTRGSGPPHVIVGSGFYKNSPITGDNELQLDLSVDANVPEAYSSDTVPMMAVFPEIDVQISKNQGICFDTVMTVRARPTPRLAVERSRLRWDSGLEIVGYDIVTGSLRRLLASNGDFAMATTTCAANDLAAAELAFTETPELADGIWILVRAGESTYDTDTPGQAGSRDPGIAGSSFSCP